jgi:hypothetical protein
MAVTLSVERRRLLRMLVMADMFGAGYGDTSKTREQLAAGMKAVHDDLAFTLTAVKRRMRRCSPRPPSSV